ncbi:unnamed protein product, partial [Prorocentrum cordatum]
PRRPLEEPRGPRIIPPADAVQEPDEPSRPSTPTSLGPPRDECEVEDETRAYPLEYTGPAQPSQNLGFFQGMGLAEGAVMLQEPSYRSQHVAPRPNRISDRAAFRQGTDMSMGPMPMAMDTGMGPVHLGDGIPEVEDETRAESIGGRGLGRTMTSLTASKTQRSSREEVPAAPRPWRSPRDDDAALTAAALPGDEEASLPHVHFTPPPRPLSQAESSKPQRRLFGFSRRSRDGLGQLSSEGASASE